MEAVNVRELVDRLGSNEDGARKKAAFGLQTYIGDPSFADIFIAEGGLANLRQLVIKANGNTLAYSLTSLTRTLEVDKGWEYVDQALIERVVELVVTHPLVNILRGAMSILVAIVTHSSQGPSAERRGPSGFGALKPALAKHPAFLEMLVSRLSSADHALCANALQLINSLMRDAMMDDSDLEWPRFIRRLQDLGVIKAVYSLMQSSGLQDLAHPLLEFQALTKVLLRKWRDVPVDQDRPEHRRALKGLHLASNPERPDKTETTSDGKKARAHNPEKWRRLGFDTESPAAEFYDVGYLGMMDLTDFVRRHEDGYQKLLLEQATRRAEQRCPIAKASLAVTLILYDYFEVDKPDIEDAKSYLALDTRAKFDRVFRPLLLQWSRLHTAGLQAAFRLWKSTGADVDDFEKVEDLVRILVDHVVGQASYTKDIRRVEEEMNEMDHLRLRELQMEQLEATYENAWGRHLRQVREELRHEAFQFVREQRIRCLLRGRWFPRSMEYKSEQGPVTRQDLKRSVPSAWRFIRLSHNRRYLHFADYDARREYEPGLEALGEKVDLATASSVECNIPELSAPARSDTSELFDDDAADDGDDDDPSQTANTTTRTSMKIMIHAADSASRTAGNGHQQQHQPPSSSPADDASSVLLTFFPQSRSVASEWVDGLRMLLHEHQQRQQQQQQQQQLVSTGTSHRRPSSATDSTKKPGINHNQVKGNRQDHHHHNHNHHHQDPTTSAPTPVPVPIPVSIPAPAPAVDQAQPQPQTQVPPQTQAQAQAQAQTPAIGDMEVSSLTLPSQKLVSLIAEYGQKIRLLNLHLSDYEAGYGYGHGYGAGGGYGAGNGYGAGVGVGAGPGYPGGYGAGYGAGTGYPGGYPSGNGYGPGPGPQPYPARYAGAGASAGAGAPATTTAWDGMNGMNDMNGAVQAAADAAGSGGPPAVAGATGAAAMAGAAGAAAMGAGAGAAAAAGWNGMNGTNGIHTSHVNGTAGDLRIDPRRPGSSGHGAFGDTGSVPVPGPLTIPADPIPGGFNPATDINEGAAPIGGVGPQISAARLLFLRPPTFHGIDRNDAPPVPSRQGLDEDEFYYDVFGS